VTNCTAASPLEAHRHTYIAPVLQKESAYYFTILVQKYAF